MIHLFSAKELSSCIDRNARFFPRLMAENMPCCVFYAHGKRFYCHFHWLDVLEYFDVEGLLK